MAIAQLLPAIPQLMYLVHKKIFEGLDLDEDKKLEHGIKSWVKADDLDYKDKRDLSYMVQALIADEKGEWGKVKDALARHSVDWRKVYRDMWS